MKWLKSLDLETEIKEVIKEIYSLIEFRKEKYVITTITMSTQVRRRRYTWTVAETGRRNQ